MKELLQRSIRALKNYSESLDKKSIFLDKPWGLIDESGEIQKLIFKSNKELILSKDGKVQIGKWDYFPEAKSLLIDRVQDIILCNESYIDHAIMILKRDGTKDEYFVLANENLIPDYNVLKYLKTKRYKELKIGTIRLLDGRTLEIENGINLTDGTVIQSLVFGQIYRVYFEGIPISEGSFVTKDKYHTLQVLNGKILNRLWNTQINTDCNKQLIISGLYDIKEFPKNEPVVDEEANKVDGTFYFKKGSIRIQFEEGYAKDIVFLKQYKVSKGLTLTIHQRLYSRIKLGDKAFISDKIPPDGIYKVGIFKSICVKDGVVSPNTY